MSASLIVILYDLKERLVRVHFLHMKHQPFCSLSEHRLVENLIDLLSIVNEENGDEADDEGEFKPMRFVIRPRSQMTRSNPEVILLDD